MNKYIGYFLIGFAVLLYVLSAITFFSYLYAFTIRDTVSAIESAFGTLVLLVIMLVMAKFAMAAGKDRLQREGAGNDRPDAGSDEPPPG